MGLMLIIIDVFHIIFDSVSREKSALPLTIEGTSKTKQLQYQHKITIA